MLAPSPSPVLPTGCPDSDPLQTAGNRRVENNTAASLHCWDADHGRDGTWQTNRAVCLSIFRVRLLLSLSGPFWAHPMLQNPSSGTYYQEVVEPACPYQLCRDLKIRNEEEALGNANNYVYFAVGQY